MKAVITEYGIGEDNDILLTSSQHIVYGEGYKKLRIFIRNRGGEEVIEINGDDAVEILPNASNSFYVKVGSRK